MVNAVIMRLYGKCGVLHMNEVLNRKLDTLKMNIKLQNKINNRWKNMPLKTA